MDDKEYYSLMNRSSSWALQQALKKQNSDSQKKKLQTNASSTSSITSTQSTESYKSLEARQGRADAEMLMEKKEI
ncbi:MAG: hypothetical protein J5527_06195 [Treponema sp.]|nr:hypothetical protein [Treponema sp.]